MYWWVTALHLCAFGVFIEFRPTEPYLYRYQHDDLNITDADLNGRVYTVGTYAYTIALIPILLLTDVLLYKAVLVVEALSYVAIWVTLIFFKSIVSQQIGQVLYGLAMSCEVAYYAYIYVTAEKEHFSDLTTWSRSALLFGKTFSYILSEVIILTGIGSYKTLNWITLGSLCIGFILSLFLPWISWQDVIYKRLETQTEEPETETQPNSYFQFVSAQAAHFKKQFMEIYRDWRILKWSFWWAMATCGELQIGNYTQTLWGQLQRDDDGKALNGFIEAACPFFSILAIQALQRISINWDRWGEYALAVAAFIDAGLLYVMSRAGHLWIMYTCYICFRVAYQAMITVAQFNLVTHIASNSFGFVFGINTFIAVVLQSLLTLFVVDDAFLGLAIRKQFVVYAGYYVVIGVIFVTVFGIRLIATKFCRSKSVSVEDDELA